MTNEEDFMAQTGMLSENITSAGHLVDFFPKFHCEINWIEYYWGISKRFARDHCNYTIDALRITIPLALSSVSNPTIHAFYHQCLRRVEAYRAGIDFGTQEFGVFTKQYKSHRRVYFLNNDM
jgi:hypothetical protein